MRRWIFRIGYFVLIAASLALWVQGCGNGGTQSAGDDEETPPGIASLSVSPTTLDFGPSAEVLTFEVANSGAGKLVWYVKECCPFANCDPDLGAITDASGTVTVRINRKAMNSSTSGHICVDSNGGESTLTVIVEVCDYLYGTVADRATGEPIEGAAVTAGTTWPVTTFSLADGTYSMWVQKGDIVDVSAAKVGYNDFFNKPFISGDPPGYTLDIVMDPS